MLKSLRLKQFGIFKLKDRLSIFKIKLDKEYFMLEEILEQKEVFTSLCKKFFDENLNINLRDFPVKKWNRIIICASGSSKNAGEIAKYVIESLAKIPCSIEYASEFAHKDTPIGKNDLFIAISQSGNTADTFEALLKAKSKGAKTFALTNDINSKIHNNADYKILADAGIEKSIAATKSFTAQLFILYVFAIGLAEKIYGEQFIDLKREFVEISEKYEEIFLQRPKIKKIAKKIKKAKSLVILARNINSALAKEGGLKIKETCYINAISAPSGEFLHGHFAFLDKNVPIFGILNKAENDEENYNLALNNLYEIKKKRRANVILIRTKDDYFAEEKIGNKFSVEIPEINRLFTPFLNLIALQLIAYETAKLIHDNIDKPRDLTKCVVSE